MFVTVERVLRAAIRLRASNRDFQSCTKARAEIRGIARVVIEAHQFEGTGAHREGRSFFLCLDVSECSLEQPCTVFRRGTHQWRRYTLGHPGPKQKRALSRAILSSKIGAQIGDSTTSPVLNGAVIVRLSRKKSETTPQKIGIAGEHSQQ